MKSFTEATARAFNYAIAGIICLILTLGIVSGVMFKIPMDTQFISMVNNVIILFVGFAVKEKYDKAKEDKEREANAPDTSRNLQTK